MIQPDALKAATPWRSSPRIGADRGAPRHLPDDPRWATPKAWAGKRGHEAIVRPLDDFDAPG